MHACILVCNNIIIVIITIMIIIMGIVNKMYIDILKLYIIYQNKNSLLGNITTINLCNYDE